MCFRLPTIPRAAQWSIVLQVGGALIAAFFLLISTQVFGRDSNLRMNHVVVPSAVSADLKKSTVLRVLKSRSGVLWFYTFEGLVMYDGRTIQNMGFPEELKQVGLFSDIISLLESSDGSISIATKNGIYHLEENDNRATQRRWSERLATKHGGLTLVRQVKLNTLLLGFRDGTVVAAEPKEQEVRAIAKLNGEFAKSGKESPSGFYHLMTNLGQFYRIDTHPLSAEATKIPGSCYVRHTSFSQFLALSEHRFLAATASGEVLDIDIKRDRCQEVILENEKGSALQHPQIHAMVQIPQSNYVAVGTDSGLHRLRIDKTIYQDTIWDSELPSTEVTSLTSDVETGIWIGTYRGTSLLTQSSIIVRSADREPLLKSITSINTKSEFGTVIATYAQLLSHIESEHLVDSPPSRVLDTVQTDAQIMVTAATSEEIIIGYRAAGLSRHDIDSKQTTNYSTTSKPSLSSDRVSTLLVSRSGDLYVGTYGGGVNIVSLNNSISTIRSSGSDSQLPSDNVILLAEDHLGRIWLGTEAGLVRFEPDTNTFRGIHFDNGENKQNLVAWCLAFTSNGKVLAGTPNNGIFEIVSGVNGPLFAKKILDRGPLGSTAIFSLETSGIDTIWAATSNALWRVNADGTKADRYGSSVGIGSLEFDMAVSAKDSQGNLYFGGSNGYAVFNPKDMDFERKPSPMLLTGLDIAGDNGTPSTALPYLQNVEISYRDRYITFMFNVIDYFDTSQNRYRYMLEGFDPDWVEAGDRDSATFTNLPAGHYVFRAQGSNSDGVWNREGIRINLVVHPAPWRTWWAYVLYTLLLAGFFWSLKKTYDTYMLKEKATAMAETMNRAVEDAMDDIQEQLENQDTLVKRFHQRSLDTLSLIAQLQQPGWPEDPQTGLPALESLENTLSYRGDQLLFDLQACTNRILADVLAKHPNQSASLNTIVDVPNLYLPASLGSYLAIALYELTSDAITHLPKEDGNGNYIQISVTSAQGSPVQLTVLTNTPTELSDTSALLSSSSQRHNLVHVEELLETVGATLQVDGKSNHRVVVNFPEPNSFDQVATVE